MAATEQDRYVVESPFFMGRNEKRAFTLDTTPDGGSPANPTITLFDITLNTEVDVTATKTTGTTTAAGAMITTAFIFGLTVGSQYLLEIKWERGSEIKSALLVIHGRK